MKTRQWLIFLFVLVVAGSFLHAQDGTDDVRLFQSFFFDAPIVTNNVVEGGFQYDTWDSGKILQIGGRGNYALNEKTDLVAFVCWEGCTSWANR